MYEAMSTTKTESQHEGINVSEILVRALIVISLLYLFLVGVNTLSDSFKYLGEGFAKGLIDVSSNPIVSLMSGILATVLVQSSSVTTSLIVGLVASSALPFENAIPMIMGANLGTSVTNTLVSLGYVNNSQNFKRAFAAATVHDFFNILTTVVLLPLEMATGVLSKTAQTLAATFYGSSSSTMEYSSPLKAAIKPFSKGIKHFVTGTLELEKVMAGTVMVIISGLLIVIALSLIVKTMKVLVESNKGEIIDRLLSKSPYATVLFGTLLTIAVQSSSITTSLLVPMAGAGILSIHSVMPVTVGANIGTTTTALIAALAGNVHGLGIALVHFLFNALGMLLWFVHPKLRAVPVICAEKLGELTVRSRAWGFAYIIGVFFVIPLGMTLLLK